MPLGIDFTQILLHLFNVVILFAGLYYLLYSPVAKFMDKRKEYYESLDKQAQDKLSEADQMKQEYQMHLDSMEQEKADQKKKLADELSAYRQTQMDQVKTESEKILNRTTEEALHQKEVILSEVKGEIASLVQDATKKLMFEEQTEQIYDAFLDEVERGEKDGE